MNRHTLTAPAPQRQLGCLITLCLLAACLLLFIALFSMAPRLPAGSSGMSTPDKSSKACSRSMSCRESKL